MVWLQPPPAPGCPVGSRHKQQRHFTFDTGIWHCLAHTGIQLSRHARHAHVKTEACTVFQHCVQCLYMLAYNLHHSGSSLCMPCDRTRLLHTYVLCLSLPRPHRSAAGPVRHSCAAACIQCTRLACSTSHQACRHQAQHVHCPRHYGVELLNCCGR